MNLRKVQIELDIINVQQVLANNLFFGVGMAVAVALS
jgi:hypothetical protein